MGLRKTKLTWHKVKNDLTIVFSVQKSQYSSDTWYYSFGICLHEISDGKTQSIGNCQIKYRVDQIINGIQLTPEMITQLLERWDVLYGDMKKLRICAVEGKLPGQCTIRAMRYLTSVNLSNL
jgi:hypothetical protein